MFGTQATADASLYDDGVFSDDLGRRNVLQLALAVEGGLFVAAMLGGWWFGVSPWPGLFDGPNAIGLAILYGIAAGLVLTAAGIGQEWLPGRSMREFRAFVHSQIAPVFADCSVFTLAVIAIAAGIGEEVFFRGFLQQGLSLLWPGSLGAAAAVILAALLFGVCHALTRVYFVLATIGGLLFGGLYLWSGNIVTPAIAHAVYDFLILLYLVRRPR